MPVPDGCGMMRFNIPRPVHWAGGNGRSKRCSPRALRTAGRGAARTQARQAHTGRTGTGCRWPRQRAEARELLAPIYGWFTEGFDTADLLDAQTLFSTLATEP
jgi:predicted ATPase